MKREEITCLFGTLLCGWFSPLVTLESSLTTNKSRIRMITLFYNALKKHNNKQDFKKQTKIKQAQKTPYKYSRVNLDVCNKCL